MGDDFFNLPVDAQQDSLTIFAHEVLKEYGILKADIECINFEFNATFRVTTESGEKFALRININSTRSLENVLGEIEWVRFLNRVPKIHTPTPIATVSDDFVAIKEHKDSGSTLFAVMYSWLEGDELGDQPTLSQLHEVGRALAELHLGSKDFALSVDSKLPIFNDFFWGAQDYLFAKESSFDASVRELIQQAHDLIMETTQELYATSSVQIIHADLHGWNLMWHENKLSIFDFDDCGFGLRAQDIAVALYYLDTPEQDEALLNGYKSVTELPAYSPNAMKALLLQRRLLLLNYLCETKNPEHRAMLPVYLEKTLERIAAFLADVRG